MPPRRRSQKQIQPALGPEKAVGQAIRQLREEQGISQEQLAYDAGLDRSYMSMLERGLRSPTVRTLVRLAETLEVRPSEIFLRMEQLLRSAANTRSSK